MKYKKQTTTRIAAAKSGMSEKTARKYLALGKLPSELKQPRTHRTRTDPFEDHAEEIKALYRRAPELQALTILEYLMEKYPGRYEMKHARTLRRRLRNLKAEFGKEQEVMFCQNIKPGRQSQSDWTCMNGLKIEIGGQLFPHLLFHFMLPYSRWEHVSVCFSESFESLTEGCERAFWQLGGVLEEHRTDNLSAATQKLGSGRVFTQRWQEFCAHYGIKPSRNNPGVSHENGSVEKSHDLLKTSIDQHLLLRGSRKFESLEAYELFLNLILLKRNEQRKSRVAEEAAFLRPLPEQRYNSPEVIPVWVNTLGVIRLKGVTYSVPTRLIGFELIAYLYRDHIELYYGQKKIEDLKRGWSGEQISYLHLIDQLVRKPKAFEQYKYRDSFFPHPLLKKAHERLQKENPAQADKTYLLVLQMAKRHGEHSLIAALEILEAEDTCPTPQAVKDLIDPPVKPSYEVHVLPPELSLYDGLHSFHEGEQTCH